mmetsp:Transcript_11103/g.30674  ORF Transcript_11103/g.30674 Transcript_11103/m.30674 type:complete len:354 (-) Transcript_11103:96-1157(-)
MARPRVASAFNIPATVPEDSVEDSTATISGVSGSRLEQELASWRRRKKANELKLQPLNTLEHVELQVKTYYDSLFGSFFNFIYDLLQFSSGRDKFCCILQNFAKIASARFAVVDSERYWMYRGIEDRLSDGRKIFRFFKEFREVYKIRRGYHRMQAGISDHGAPSIPAACGMLDVCAHVASFHFYLFDNLLWATTVGIFRAKEVPKWQRKMWVGGRRNGAVVAWLGGVTQIKRRKDGASIVRIVCAMLANILLFKKAVSDCSERGGAFQGCDDPRLFHTLEIIGMAASLRDLLSRLGVAPLEDHAYIGALGIIGSAVGLWSNWRKVRKDQCGTKQFTTTVERRLEAQRRSLGL